MAPRPKNPAIPKQVMVKLSEELGIDLAAFSWAYYNAPFAVIVREAIKDHIERMLDREPERKAAFLANRAALRKQPLETFRILDRVPRSEQSG